MYWIEFRDINLLFEPEFIYACEFEFARKIVSYELQMNDKFSTLLLQE